MRTPFPAFRPDESFRGTRGKKDQPTGEQLLFFFFTNSKQFGENRANTRTPGNTNVKKSKKVKKKKNVKSHLRRTDQVERRTPEEKTAKVDCPNRPVKRTNRVAKRKNTNQTKNPRQIKEERKENIERIKKRTGKWPQETAVRVTQVSCPFSFLFFLFAAIRLGRGL